MEVRIRMDESRRLKATVYVPLLDQEYEAELVTSLERPDYDDLVASLVETKGTLAAVESHVTKEEETILVQTSRQIEQLEATLMRVERGESGEAERIQKQLADAKAEIRPLKEKYGLIAQHQLVLELIEFGEGLCRRFDDRMALAKLSDLRGDADKALRLEQERTLDTVEERVRDTYWPLYRQTRECWEEHLDALQAAAPLASDPLAFHEHVHAAKRALLEGDLTGCSLQVSRAWRFIPERIGAKNRFHDAALRG